MNLIQNYSADGHLTLTIWDSWLHIEALKNEDDSGGFGDALIFQLSVVAQEVFALVERERVSLAKQFNRFFDTVIYVMADPMM